MWLPDTHTHRHTDRRQTDAWQSDPYVRLCFTGDTIQWWFINPGSDSPEISLVRTKSAVTKFRVRTNGRFSNLENSLIRKYWLGTNVSGLTNNHCKYNFVVPPIRWVHYRNQVCPSVDTSDTITWLVFNLKLSYFIPWCRMARGRYLYILEFKGQGHNWTL